MKLASHHRQIRQMPLIGNPSLLVATIFFGSLFSEVSAAEPVFPEQFESVTANGISPPTADAECLVNELGSDSYHKRRSADEKLRHRLATDSLRSQTTDALRAGLKHPSLEIRLASDRLLRHHQAESFAAQVEKLLNPRVAPDSIRLAGWKRYSETAGTDHAARSLFAKLASSHGQALRALDRDATAELLNRFNPYQVARDDLVTWALVLMIEPNDVKTPQSITYRTAMALSNSALGPKTSGRIEDIVLRRMIDHWIGRNRSDVSARDRLRIAMRFSCHRRARELHDEVFADSDASPSSQVIAMLCAAVLESRHQESDGIEQRGLERLGLDSVLRDRLDDRRTAHVWQLIASRQTKIRTQVRDVALALLLHRQGIDPRQVGFEELQADPVMLFRDHSLGFADEVQRTLAHARGKELLRGNERLQVGPTDSVE